MFPPLSSDTLAVKRSLYHTDSVGEPVGKMEKVTGSSEIPEEFRRPKVIDVSPKEDGKVSDR
jgi:hypothetical protein